METPNLKSMSRRRMLKSATAAAAGAGAMALLGGGSNVLAEPQGAPAVRTNTQAGRRIRAFVKLDKTEPPSVQTITMRALTGRQVAVRTEAAQTCYSSVGQVLLPSPTAPANISVVGHGGVGIVEAVGPEVFALQPGDRVIAMFHSSCGWCHNCTHGHEDQCVAPGQLDHADFDGKPVASGTSGMTEVMVLNQERLVPVFTDLSSIELSMIPCVGNSGLGMAMSRFPVEPGTDVVVFGAGPVGLSALQGARIKGAARLIMVEPIAYRRDIAMKMGATDVVDPNRYTRRTKNPPTTGINFEAYQDELIDHIRDMVKTKTDRVFAGRRIGPDHVIEAAGGDAYGGVTTKPSAGSGPDPTGMTVLTQIWQLGSDIGTIVSCSIGFPLGANVEIPANNWCDGAKHFQGGTGGGGNGRRDVPRYIRLMEAGKLDFKTMAAKTYSLKDATEAYNVAMNRTVVATIVTPNT
jgi:S-(hydroxymethyl)glutathione dehydrogenase / alcohol dehydrogenase